LDKATLNQTAATALIRACTDDEGQVDPARVSRFVRDYNRQIGDTDRTRLTDGTLTILVGCLVRIPNVAWLRAFDTNKR
jgi:hypothetical protein